MRIKKLALIVALTALPLLSYADITITNNTDSYGTGSIGISPCSSIGGDQGVIKPHGSLKVPNDVIGLYCGLGGCDAHLFASKDCSGNEIATLAITIGAGVVSVRNLDPEHFVVSGQGPSVVINPGKKSFLDRLVNFIF